MFAQGVFNGEEIAALRVAVRDGGQHCGHLAHRRAALPWAVPLFDVPLVAITEHLRLHDGAPALGMVATSACLNLGFVVMASLSLSTRVVVGTSLCSLAAFSSIAFTAGLDARELDLALCGGGMLERPELLPGILAALRKTIVGSFSIKVRAGYSDPEQIFSLLPVFEDAGVDFLVLHARTVVQRYDGFADHGITARVVQRTKLPVIANGDVNSVEVGQRVLGETGAAGLMLGRGAMKDPLLFERLRGRAAPLPSSDDLLRAHQRYLRQLAEGYGALFHGDAQVLAKLKSSLAVMDVPDDWKPFKAVKKAKSVAAFCDAVEAFVPQGTEPSSPSHDSTAR